MKICCSLITIMDVDFDRPTFGKTSILLSGSWMRNDNLLLSLISTFNSQVIIKAITRSDYLCRHCVSFVFKGFACIALSILSINLTLMKDV